MLVSSSMCLSTSWNSNILNNCKLAEQYSLYSFSDDNTAIINKTAVIVAAGPSLDRTLNILSDIKDREKYFPVFKLFTLYSVIGSGFSVV